MDEENQQNGGDVEHEQQQQTSMDDVARAYMDLKSRKGDESETSERLGINVKQEIKAELMSEEMMAAGEPVTTGGGEEPVKVGKIIFSS